MELHKCNKERLEEEKKHHSFEKAPKIDLNSYGKNSRLRKRYKRIMNWETNLHGPFTRKQIIVGIQLRCKEFFPHDPNYVERLTKELDFMIIFQVQLLYSSIFDIENSM